jgi:hypothetical protein
MSYGAQLKFGMARQTSGGTAVNPVTSPNSYHGLPLLSEDVGLDKAELISQNLIGKFEQGAVYSGVANVAGTISFEATPRNLIAALASCVNWSPVLATSGSMATYTFLPNTKDYDSTYVKSPWTIYKQFTDSNSAEQFYDCQMDQLEFTVGQGQFLKGKLTVAAGVRAATGVGSANVGALSTDVGMLFPWNVASISLGGAAMNQASELSITLNENINALYTANGTLAPFKYSRSGFREVTVRGTFYMNDRSILNAFANETQQQLLVTLINTKTMVQSGYGNTLVIDIPQLKVTAFKPGASGPGELSVGFQARGVIDPTSAYAIQYTMISTYAGGL